MPFGHFWKNTEQRLYLDYAAATPVRPDIREAMLPYFSDTFGNPSAIHKEGVAARNVIEDMRTSLARTLRVRASDVTFTSCGTESNNLAIHGHIKELVEGGGKSFSDIEIISTKIEHPSILRVLEHLEHLGVEVKYVPTDGEGLIDEKELKKLLSNKTVLATFAYVNSEVGVVQDVKRLSRIIKKYNAEHAVNICIHLDASQAPLWLPCQLDSLGVEMMTLDAGKCYGPKGVGVLAKKHTVNLRRIILGGEQEMGMRAGTENVPLIVGCVTSIVRAQEGYERRSAKTKVLQTLMIEALEKEIEGVYINGSRKDRVANNVNISILGLDSEFAVIALDSKGIAASTKSACSGGSGAGSYVVEAITGDSARATSTIRFSLGEETTKHNVLFAVKVLKEHVAKMRRATLS